MTSQILAIAHKDIKEYFSSKPLVMAVLILPLLISLAVPSLIHLLLTNVPTTISPQVTKFLPPVLKNALITMGPQQALYWYMFTVITLPMFLLLPITSVIVLASDSFAGEKERRTIENLLAEPVSMRSLFIGKTLAPVCIALTVTWVSVIIYWLLASYYGALADVRLVPDPAWFSAVLILVPALTFTNVGFVSWISSLSKGFRESQQLSGVLIIPIAAIVLTSATGNLQPTVSLNIALAILYMLVFTLGLVIWAKFVEPKRLIE